MSEKKLLPSDLDNLFALRNNALGKLLKKYSEDSSQWDTTPTENSTKPCTSGGVYTALSIKIQKLWENESPTSQFNPQTIALLTNTCDYFIVISKYYKTMDTQTSSICQVGSSVRCQQVIDTSGSYVRVLQRPADTSQNSITFDDCWVQDSNTTGVVNNNHIVPVVVLGVKL